MKRFTKLFLTLALLCVAGSASAERIYADLSKYGDKWDAANGVLTFSWTSRYGNQLQPELNVAAGANAFKGDLTSWEKLVVEVSEINVATFFRILVYNTNEKDGNNQDFSNTLRIETGRNEIILAKAGIKDLSDVKRMVISGSNSDEMSNENPASFKITAIYLERPDVISITEKEVFEAPEGTTDVNDIVYGADQKKWNIAYPQNVGNETLFGGDIDSDNKSLDISDYDYLHFIVSDASAAHTGLRVFVTDNKNARQTLYPHPIENADTVTNWTATNWITESGTYVVKISDYPLLRGFKALQGWAGNSGTITVSDVYLSKGAPATPTGKYTLAGSESLEDLTATCFDITKVTKTGISLEAANPNALFIANEGQLTNEKNVIINNVCANLELTDGYTFNSPVAFTATKAKFTKTMNADYGTMVIPFTAAVPEGVEAYEITANNGEVLTTNKVEEITANKPVMLKGSGEVSFTASNAEIAATAEGVQTNGLLSGVYAATAVPTENTYVLQEQGGDVNFYKAISDLTVNPFRAYLTTAAAAARLTFDFNEATGIKTVKTTEGTEVYNLQGVRVANPTKGLYIVNGKKVIK